MVKVAREPVLLEKHFHIHFSAAGILWSRRGVREALDMEPELLDPLER